MPARIKLIILSLACFCLLHLDVKKALGETPIAVKTVFVILMENHDWSDGLNGILGTTNCAYINNTLLPKASYCSQYYNPPGNHPSEPNYLWLEGGSNFGITDDNPANRVASTNHLTTLLNKSNISWKSYQQDMVSDPLVDQNNYVVRHDPMVFFNDVNGNVAYMNAHVRPYTEFATDLLNNTVARYNFITPNLTNDMHNPACSGCSARVSGDHWLSLEIPKIMVSAAYTNSGAIFITWDEGKAADGPIGLIVLSPLAKGHGYSNTNHYNHGSTLRTMQNIFGVRPYLGDAANVTDLSDLFVAAVVPPKPPGFRSATLDSGSIYLAATNAIIGTTNYIQTSSNLTNWTTLFFTVPTSTTFSFSAAVNPTNLFFRIKQGP